MIVLGIDPGTRFIGFGIISYQDKAFSLLHSEVKNLTGLGSTALKLGEILKTVTDLNDRFHPAEFAIETAFYGKNVQSALKIAHARGAAIAAASSCGLKVFEYSPREIKQASTGRGNASKESVQYMVKSLLGLKGEMTSLDESDALAVAICHCLKKGSQGRSGSGWSDFIKNNPDRIVQ